VRIRPAAVAALADLHQPSDRDCCVWARLVLRRAYGAEVVDAVPLWRWHLVRDSGAGPWEPALAAVAAGVATDVIVSTDGLPDAPRGPALVQGWRGEPFAQGVSGHTFLALPIADGWFEILDSTRDRGPRLLGLQRWSDYVGQFRAGGVAVAALRRPPP
jgi:hypothetical protein